MESAVQRVKRGAATLDKLQKTWYKKIDLSTLDITYPSECICGQLGIWEKPRYAAFVDKSVENGIMSGSGSLSQYFKESKHLTNLWKKEIHARLG